MVAIAKVGIRAVELMGLVGNKHSERFNPRFMVWENLMDKIAEVEVEGLELPKRVKDLRYSNTKWATLAS